VLASVTAPVLVQASVLESAWVLVWPLAPASVLVLAQVSALELAWVLA
jgi:hypothetical protein